jgi:hypothetical protein
MLCDGKTCGPGWQLAVYLNGSNWYRWLETRASDFEMICIAGDLLDMFSAVPQSEQIDHAIGFLIRLAAGTRVAVCSGNQDQIQTEDLFSSAPWLQEFADLENIIPDDKTVVIGQELVITTISYSAPTQRRLALMEQGENLRSVRELRWLVMHHIPPTWHAAVKDSEEIQAEGLVSEFEPDYFGCGHLHQLPQVSERGWLFGRPERQPSLMPVRGLMLRTLIILCWIHGSGLRPGDPWIKTRNVLCLREQGWKAGADMRMLLSFRRVFRIKLNVAVQLANPNLFRSGSKIERAFFV